MLYLKSACFFFYFYFSNNCHLMLSFLIAIKQIIFNSNTFESSLKTIIIDKSDVSGMFCSAWAMHGISVQCFFCLVHSNSTIGSLYSREHSLFTKPHQCCWRILLIRPASMILVLRDHWSTTTNPRTRWVLGGQVLLRVCFSASCRLKLSWVACCFTQLSQAQLKGSEVLFLSAVKSLSENLWFLEIFK